MKCKECGEEVTDWEKKFYPNGCGSCYIAENHKKNQPVQGQWSRNAKQELETFSKDTLQPFRKDGTVNKHFVQAHGTQALEKETKLSSRDIRENADKYG